MALLDTIRDADQAARRLSESLTYDIAPVADRLRRLLKERKQGVIVDKTISEETWKFLEKDRQLQVLYEQLVAYCLEVDKGLGRAIAEHP